MKFILSLLVVLTVTMTGFCQSQKTLVKSIDLQGATMVASGIKSTVNVTEWDKDYIRVTATINVENFSEDILQKLVMVGRYDIQASKNAEGKLELLMPALDRRVIIKGTDLIEHLTLEIAVPQGVTIELNKMEASL